MSLLSDSALLMWHDIPQQHARDHGAWHSIEHLPERRSLPGFLRGRRGVLDQDDGTRKIFILYELSDLGIMSSPEYLARLNHPTSWSERINPLVSNFSRSPARVVYSESFGIGMFAETILVTRQSEAQHDLADTLAAGLRDIEESVRLTGRHLFEATRDDVAQTKEQALRGGQDSRADIVVLFEGFDADLLREEVDKYMADVQQDQRLQIQRLPFTLAHIA